jgi:uncharacterized membrane protein YraQ (UPF0718 family)
LFIAGSFFVGLLQEYLPPERVERILRRYDGGSGNVVAAGTGAITPFCSASTVPVLAGLLGAGAPLGIAFSFLLASPLVNELAVILLLGIFGIRTTALYVGLTAVAAIIGGIVIGRLELEHHIKDTQLLAPDDGNVAADGGRSSISCEAGETPESDVGRTIGACGDTSSAQPETGCGPTSGKSTTHRIRVKRAATGAKGFFVGLLPYLVLGMTLGAVIHTFIPASFIHKLIGPENPFAVLIAAVAGAPIYVSMSAMLPIAASFTDQGIPIGTVLAFVVGSAGVSLPNLVLLNKLFDRTLLAMYTLTVVTTGIVVGVLFNSSLL